MGWMKSMAIAFAMYSKIPMPKADWNEKNMKYALCFFPLVGAAVGTVFFAVWKILVYLNMGKLLSSAVLTAVPVLVTGGIHIDGFLDTMDARSSYQTKERKLEILKDSHTGAFAIIGGILYFLLYFGGVSEVDSAASCFMVTGGFVCSRSLSALSLVTIKSARKNGLLYAFSSTAHKNITRCVVVFWLLGSAIWLYLFGGIRGIAVLAAALLVYGYYWYFSLKEFGGITGDLAGYFLQLCELAMLYSVVLFKAVL